MQCGRVCAVIPPDPGSSAHIRRSENQPGCLPAPRPGYRLTGASLELACLGHAVAPLFCSPTRRTPVVMGQISEWHSKPGNQTVFARVGAHRAALQEPNLDGRPAPPDPAPDIPGGTAIPGSDFLRYRFVRRQRSSVAALAGCSGPPTRVDGRRGSPPRAPSPAILPERGQSPWRWSAVHPASNRRVGTSFAADPGTALPDVGPHYERPRRHLGDWLQMPQLGCAVFRWSPAAHHRARRSRLRVECGRGQTLTGCGCPAGRQIAPIGQSRLQQ